MNKVVLTTKQILEAHEAHGDDFVVIDLESTRKFKTFAQYISINIKLAEGNIVPIRYWKLSNDGIVLSSRIRSPEQRKFEAIRLGISLNDDNDEENDNSQALKVLCEAVENKLNKMKEDGVITDNERAARKQPDGTYRPMHLISTKIVTPMQLVALDRETDEFVDLENPRFWISLPKKKFFKNPSEQRPSIHFEEKYYVDENNQPDINKPVMTHEYAPVFYNVDDWYHHARTGKKVFKKLGAINEDDEIIIDNTNVQEYLTKGSAIMGNLNFELVVSGRQCKLEVSLYGNCYVKHADASDGDYNNVDEDEVTAFSDKYAKLGSGNSNQQVDKIDDIDDTEDLDF